MRAIACLPALVGAWRQRRRRPAAAAAVGVPGELGRARCTRSSPRPGTRVVNQFLLGRALTGEMALDPPITCLVVYNSNPMVVCPEQDEGGARPGPRGPVHRGQRPLPHRHGPLRRHRAARHHPARAARHHVQLGPLLRLAEHPGGRAARRGGAQHRAVPQARRPDGLHRGVLHPQRRGDGGRRVRLDRPGDAGHHRRVVAGDRLGRLNLPSRDEYAPHAEGNFPTPSGKTEFRTSSTNNFVSPLFRQGSNDHQPGARSTRSPTTCAPRETADSGYRLNLHLAQVARVPQLQRSRSGRAATGAGRAGPHDPPGRRRRTRDHRRPLRAGLQRPRVSSSRSPGSATRSRPAS